MKKTFLAMAVLAIGLPSLALAGGPVPMTDDDLDSVAAGVSLQTLLKADPEAILSHPEYGARSQALVSKYNSLNSNQQAQLASRLSRLSDSDRSRLRAITPPELQHLLGAY